jgi:hypothetical protein
MRARSVVSRLADAAVWLVGAPVAVEAQTVVGLEETGDGVWSLYLGSVLLGKIDERTTTVAG